MKFENVEIALEHTTTLNVELRVSSAAAERVEVVGSTQQLDETSNTLGTNIELKQVKELPFRRAGLGHFDHHGSERG